MSLTRDRQTTTPRQLPVLNHGLAGPRPMFGGPEVAKYGAVGLDVALVDAPAPVDASAPSLKSADGQRDVYQISRTEPLRLESGLAHHEVDGYHLWIGVDEGKLIVTDDVGHELIQLFIKGLSPASAMAHVEQDLGLDHEAAWEATALFLGRVAAAGFVKGIQGYHGVKKVRPHVFARFHLTQRCQLECVHCYTSSGPHLPSEGELPIETWLRLVNEFADNGGQKLLFTGGEALVYSGCLDIMRLAKQRGLEVTLFSNGLLIPRYIDDLKEVADIVQISVDGPDEHSHDQVRGHGSFKRAIRALHLLLDAGIQTRVSTTIMMANWEAIQRELPRFIGEFEDTDLSFRISYGAMPHGRGTELDHSLDTEAVRRYVDGVLSRVKTTENRAEGRNVIQKITGCGYAEQLVVAPDGLVYPCHLLSGALGHVDELPLHQITKYLSRTSAAFGVENRLGCGTCDLRNLCGGTCRVEDEKHTGSRLITTCTPEDKLRKKRFLVQRYRPTPS